MGCNRSEGHDPEDTAMLATSGTDLCHVSGGAVPGPHHTARKSIILTIIAFRVPGACYQNDGGSNE